MRTEFLTEEQVKQAFQGYLFTNYQMSALEKVVKYNFQDDLMFIWIEDDFK